MKTVIVIQARLGSSRLPCKTLLNLHGLPVIDWVVGRCARSELADDLVVALPDTRRDEVLARHLRGAARQEILPEKAEFSPGPWQSRP